MIRGTVNRVMSTITPFEFATATRIIFVVGTFEQVPSIVQGLGSQAFIVAAGSSAAFAEQLEQQLRQKRIGVVRFAVRGEPDIATIEAGIQAAQGCDVVIAIGGGSVIDSGKAIAGLLTNGGNLLDYVEVVGRRIALSRPAAPFIAIPTTAGTRAHKAHKHRP